MLETLYQEALKRKKEPMEGSYTSYLYDKGLDKILKKVGEEATCSSTIAVDSLPAPSYATPQTAY